MATLYYLTFRPVYTNRDHGQNGDAVLRLRLGGRNFIHRHTISISPSANTQLIILTRVSPFEMLGVIADDGGIIQGRLTVTVCTIYYWSYL